MRLAALAAGFAGPVIDAVMILIAARLVQGVAIRAVGERRAFVANGVSRSTSSMRA